MEREMQRIFVLLICLLPQLCAQEKDMPLLQQVQTKVSSEKELMKFLKTLVAVYGPRLNGSENLTAATAEIQLKMKQADLLVTRSEWQFARSWKNGATFMRVVSPTIETLNGFAIPWTGSTFGMATASIIASPILPYEPDLTKSLETYQKFFANLKKEDYRGKIVIMGHTSPPGTPDPDPKPTLSSDDIRELSKPLEESCPVIEYHSPIRTLPTDPKERACFWKRPPRWVYLEVNEDNRKVRQFTYQAFKNLGAVALVIPARDNEGTLSAPSGDPLRMGEPVPLPVVALPSGNFDRLALLAEMGVPAKVEIQVQSAISTSISKGINLIGEIPGSKQNEAVVLTCHADSVAWAGGATDDAVGCAALIEAFRVIKQLGLKPLRTLRLCVFSGEELDLLGSRDYVKNLSPSDRDGIRLVLSLDNGAGPIRGITAKAETPGRNILQKLLSGMSSLGANNLVDHSWEEGRSDDLAFAEAGIPAFSFLQDPLNYAKIHHTNQDTLRFVRDTDFRQMVVVVATVAMTAANAEELLPRRSPQ